MNESIFLLHVLVVLGFVLASLRLGKGALIALISLQGVLANLFVVKQMFFLGFSVTCSDVFAIGGILSLNLLQEYYGKEAAKQAVNISLLTLLFFAFMSQIHLLYAPTVSDTTHGAFQTIFSRIGPDRFLIDWDVLFDSAVRRPVFWAAQRGSSRSGGPLAPLFAAPRYDSF